MSKKQLHHTYRALRPVKSRYFFAASGVSGVVSVLALRSNYQTMSHLRSVLYATDQNNGNVEAALRNLRTYIYGHMNTNLASGPDAIYPPIQLKYTYQRLLAAQQASQSSTQLYTDAQHYCEQQDPVDFSGHNRVPCIEQYVSSHTTSPQLATISDSLYKFDFVSPRWSPDLAGWSLVLTATFFVVGVGLFLIKRWLKRQTA